MNGLESGFPVLHLHVISSGQWCRLGRLRRRVHSTQKDLEPAPTATSGESPFPAPSPAATAHPLPKDRTGVQRRAARQGFASAETRRGVAVADFAAESPERSWNTSNPAAFGGSEASAEVARRPVATRGASTAASGEHGSMDVDVGGDVFDAMSKALDSDVFETMQLEDEADASSKIAPAAAGDRGLDSAGQSALPLKDDAGVANDPLLEWRAGRARSDERHRNERKTEQLGQAIAGPKAALGLHGKEIADLVRSFGEALRPGRGLGIAHAGLVQERKSLETPRRKEAADGAGATGAPSLGAGAAPVAPAALATLATPATPAALRGLGSGPKLPGARVNRLSSRNQVRRSCQRSEEDPVPTALPSGQGFIRSYTPCDSTSAGASAFLASASRRKRACDVLEGKASEEVEDPTATMGSYR
eukprot:scaffold1651_cov317-Pinguiococcus_pyrenoidosus.AAC.25